MTRLLIPDGQKEHKNEVFFCLPISTELWFASQKWRVYKTRNDVAYGKFRCYAKQHDVIIVFQCSRLSDEEAMEACAWIRFENESQETIYIVPHSRSQDSITSIIHRSMGVHRDRVISMDSYTPVAMTEPPIGGPCG